MNNQMIFKRYEIKYLLTARQKQCVLEAMKPQMKLDCYGRDTIRNIYFDTDTYRLIRRSLEAPVYKEKLRLRSYYRGLKPSVFLSYEREAYYALDGSDFRVTFDENILYRQEKMSLNEAVYGTAILKNGETLMEIKTPGAIPMWMTKCLTGAGVYKTSFSKYGVAYRDILC